MEQPSITVEEQRELVAQAVRLLGGVATTAKLLGYTDRTIGRFLSGAVRIHDHNLERLSAALLAHATACRELERRLSPAFAANRTDAQAAPPRHDGNADRRAPKIPADELAQMAARLGLTARGQ